MASNYLDEFVLNFDLNHLGAEENTQNLDQKYEKIRKTASWLKSKIVNTDFAIKKYQSKKEDHEQSLKAHALTKGELKEAYINYNNVSNKCTLLEQENKMLLANQEVLKGRVIAVENKYEALISHTNQLQLLVKELENEKDALTVEKELDKCSYRDSNKEIISLQKEKVVMLNDFMALKDVILGKKKTNKRYVKLLKKYVKDIKCKGPNILCTSEESDNDMDDYADDILLHTQKEIIEVHTVTNEELISTAEQNFIDNYSDGEVSVDTGRGSSRANSHDKYLSSPDYIATLETLMKKPPEDGIKQIDAANSPITVYPLRTVATSPVMFDHPPLLENQYVDYTNCFDGAEYIIDDESTSEELNVLVEPENLADFASPIPGLSKFINTGTSPIQNYEFNILKEPVTISTNESLFIDLGENNEIDSVIEKQIPKCLCEKVDTIIDIKKNMIDACTSPLMLSPGPRKFVDIGISTYEHEENINLDKSSELQFRTSTRCEKSVCTDTIMLPERKEYVNAFTSPVAELHCHCKCIDVGTKIDNKMECENKMSRNCEKFMNFITLPDRKVVDASTSTLSPLEQHKVVDIGMDALSMEPSEKSIKSLVFNLEKLPVIDEQISKNLNKNQFSKFRDKTIINSTEALRAREKVCLESNSSKNLHFENTNDAEVQNILNVMKLRDDLISPISNTPSESQYLKLIPEMNCTLTKIWRTISNIYKVPNQLGINDATPLNCTEFDDLEEIPGIETNNGKKKCGEQQLAIVTALNQDDITDTTNRTYEETNSISTDNTCSECPELPINEDSNVIKSKRTKSRIFSNVLLPQTEDKKYPDKRRTLNSSDVNKLSEDNTNNINKTNENILMAKEDNNKEEREPQQLCSNGICEDNSNDTICSNNTDTCNKTEGPAAPTIVINGTKTKKKSKLEKFRNKLVPTCKIKKITPSIVKYSSKVQVKTKDSITSSSLNQKKAYENAVKVMAEFRSNQEQENKKKSLKCVTGKANLASISNKIESSSSDSLEPKVLSTRSHTRRLSKKEEHTIVTANSEQNIRDIEKSPLNRKARKRPANTEVDSLQSNCKRILRSSNVSQVTNEDVLRTVRNNNTVGPLHKDFEKSNKCRKKGKNGSYSKDSLSKYCNSLNDDEGDHFKLENNNCSTQNEHIGASKTEKSILRTKPVIELSKCLANNANLVSIIPGNPGYLDVNKNINHVKKSATGFNTYMQSDQNNCIEKGIKVPNNTSCAKAGRNFRNSKDGDNNSKDQADNRSEYVTEQAAPCFSDLKLRQEAKIGTKNPVVQLIPLKTDIKSSKNDIVSYRDLDLYTLENSAENETTSAPPIVSQPRKQNILCGALDRYGVISIKYTAKKVPDAITVKICQKIEESITKIIASTKGEQKNKMNDLVNSIQNFKMKHILAGLMKYLKDPTRKNELFNKIINGPAPPMTKSEVILLYVIERLNGSLFPGFINKLWNNMEHALFQLNRAPEFDVIESMSHFYAVLCRYFRNKSRLRCFMLDAMYCLQFKAVPLIRQCLDVCPGVLPNAHERMAKTSLVTCLVYLLHFYKCQDKYNRAQDIRNILYKKYQYRFSEWNETMILEIFRKAIMDLRGTHNDKKMLRVALIILCKRHGAKWCQLNIIQNILLPIIDKKDVPERIKQFCVLMLGPLLKPFPTDRKAQCEIVINQLLQMLKQNTTQEMKEAIYSSLIFMNKHDQERVVQALLFWNPENVSPEFEEILNDYVMEKPLAVWKKLVAKRPNPCT